MAASCRLARLRGLFRTSAVLPKGVDRLDAYIVPSEDAHSSEYIAACDCRREFISGFTGSKGTAIITEKEAVLYTDGRYFLQAESELLPGFALMKAGVPATPSEAEWLASVLPAHGSVGVDPTLIAAPRFRELSESLAKSGRKLISVPTNLVDQIWAGDRPARPNDTIRELQLEHAGVSAIDKLAAVRCKMVEKGQEALVLTALDEVAWLTNCRGSDIPYNPVYFAYALVTPTEAVLYMDSAKLPPELGPGSSFARTFTIQPYEHFVSDLQGREFTDKVWVGPNYSEAVRSALECCSLLEDVTPICTAKAVKNDAELAGMRACHIRDAVALCQFMVWLEGRVAANDPDLDEVSAADKLQAFRAAQSNFVTPSFATISSAGSNGSVIHYHPRKGTCRPVTASELYLLDSGGQYLDGTTDVTRTVHFSSPTEHERECFTRVLQGHISLTTLRFPQGTSGILIDAFARRSLWDAGLDYAHGTGHGVGSFLNVHEGPIGISSRISAAKAALEPGMIVTIEPGYYEDGAFGIRIENVVEVVSEPANDLSPFSKRPFMRFEPCTLFPIQHKLIVTEMLEPAQVAWINTYHARTRDALAPILQAQGLTDELAWLEKSTVPIGA